MSPAGNTDVTSPFDRDGALGPVPVTVPIVETLGGPDMTTTLDRTALRLAPLERRTVRGPTRSAGWERNGDRRDRLHLALSELFRARDDLEGVVVVADVLAEDLLWSA